MRTTQPVVLTPQLIRAEGIHCCFGLRLPIHEKDRNVRRVTVGGHSLEVWISEEDRQRGFAKINAALFWRCTETGLQSEGGSICDIVLVVCTDEGNCVEI